MFGVNIARNWNVSWQDIPDDELTGIIESPTFRGPVPFSEAETRGLKVLLEKLFKEDFYLIL